MEFDFFIVGSGLTGAVIARVLADCGQQVCVIERRAHVGGNVHDFIHYSGIPVHTYGPHYFRTNSDKVWRFVNQFASFRSFEATLKTFVDGRYENWPIAGSYIRRTVGRGWRPAFSGEPTNFEEACLAMMPKPIYEKFVKGYTEKQWGVSANELSPSLAKRFDIREDDEPRLVRHQYQGVPKSGYTKFMERMLKGIPVILNCDYLRQRNHFRARKLLVFTGPIDEFFDFDIGKLKYRGQQREHRYLSKVDWAQPCVQVNNPNPANGRHIRTLEWKHIMDSDEAKRARGTVLTRETTVTPNDPNNYEYPCPDVANTKLYKHYATRAQIIPNLLICGRLGEYRYYDMDQAIARALVLSRRIIAKARLPEASLKPEFLGCRLKGREGITTLDPDTKRDDLSLSPCIRRLGFFRARSFSSLYALSAGPPLDAGGAGQASLLVRVGVCRCPLARRRESRLRFQFCFSLPAPSRHRAGTTFALGTVPAEGVDAGKRQASNNALGSGLKTLRKEACVSPAALD